MTNIYQNKTCLIGYFKKTDSLRINIMGYSQYKFLVEIPQENIKKLHQIPCIIFGKKAEELDKSIRTGTLKDNDMVQIIGELQSRKETPERRLEPKKLIFYVKVNSFELIKTSLEQQLFEEK